MLHFPLFHVVLRRFPHDSLLSKKLFTVPAKMSSEKVLKLLLFDWVTMSNCQFLTMILTLLLESFNLPYKPICCCTLIFQYSVFERQLCCPICFEWNIFKYVRLMYLFPNIQCLRDNPVSQFAPFRPHCSSSAEYWTLLCPFLSLNANI